MSARLDQLRKTLRTYDQARASVIKEIAKEELQSYAVCSCVALNRDIGVFDCGQQERDFRKPLSVGFMVDSTLSAFTDCPSCKGTGKPQ